MQYSVWLVCYFHEGNFHILRKLESIRERLRQQKFSFQIQIGLKDKICAFESDHRFSQQLFSSLVIFNTKHNFISEDFIWV